MTAPPLPSQRTRQRLAELILSALHDPAARGSLNALARGEGAGPEWFHASRESQVHALRARAQRASAAVAAAPLGAPAGTLSDAFDDAALLFDAGLFFEAHELLESHWRGERGETREVLQGLIQIAVGYQHRAMGNARGADSLLLQGMRRLHGRRLMDLDLDGFAAAVAQTIGPAGYRAVPRFPRAPRPVGRVIP